MKVQVTPIDIQTDVRYSPRRCPIARAIRRTLGAYTRVQLYPTVGNMPGSIIIGNKPVRLSDRLSAKAMKFDREGKRALKPFSFAIRYNPKSSK